MRIDVPALTRGLKEVRDGFWLADEAADVSFPASGYDACFVLEDASFWFEHRNASILQALERYPPGAPLFDVGAGNGIVTRDLRSAGYESIAVEPANAGAVHAYQRGLLPVICGPLGCFQEGAIPSAGMFDVVEHIEDDRAFMRMAAMTMCPGARLYLTVPAFSWLWSEEDVFAGHYRRYTRRSLRRLVEEAGFRIEYSTYLFLPLVVPVLLFRALPSLFRRRGALGTTREHTAPGLAGRALRWLLRLERALLRSHRLPMGTTILLVAKRSGYRP